MISFLSACCHVYAVFDLFLLFANSYMITWYESIAFTDLYTIQFKLEQLECLCSKITPPMITHTSDSLQIPSQNRQNQS